MHSRGGARRTLFVIHLINASKLVYSARASDHHHVQITTSDLQNQHDDDTGTGIVMKL